MRYRARYYLSINRIDQVEAAGRLWPGRSCRRDCCGNPIAGDCAEHAGSAATKWPPTGSASEANRSVKRVFNPKIFVVRLVHRYSRGSRHLPSISRRVSKGRRRAFSVRLVFTSEQIWVLRSIRGRTIGAAMDSVRSIRRARTSETTLPTARFPGRWLRWLSDIGFPAFRN